MFSKKTFLFLFFITVASAGLFFSTAGKTSSAHDLFLHNATEALNKKDFKNFDFWTARFLAQAAFQNTLEASLEALKQLLPRRRLDPKIFIPGDWDQSFLDRFVQRNYLMWQVDEKRIRPHQRSFEVANATDGHDYFVTVVATPSLRSCYLTQEGIAGKSITLVLGEASEKPHIFFGKLFQNIPSLETSPFLLETKGRLIHTFWKPEFIDLDADAIPEVWLRYTLMDAAGFSQVLEIYKIQDRHSLKLFWRFEGENEGFATRREDSRVEVATGFGSKADSPRSHFDSHRIEVWQFKEEKFEKISEEVVPHLLKSGDWKKYFSV